METYKFISDYYNRDNIRDFTLTKKKWIFEPAKNDLFVF